MQQPKASGHAAKKKKKTAKAKAAAKCLEWFIIMTKIKMCNTEIKGRHEKQTLTVFKTQKHFKMSVQLSKQPGTAEVIGLTKERE